MKKMMMRTNSSNRNSSNRNSSNSVVRIAGRARPAMNTMSASS
jgi:hypothetical protein